MESLYQQQKYLNELKSLGSVGAIRKINNDRSNTIDLIDKLIVNLQDEDAAKVFGKQDKLIDSMKNLKLALTERNNSESSKNSASSDLMAKLSTALWVEDTYPNDLYLSGLAGSALRKFLRLQGMIDENSAPNECIGNDDSNKAPEHILMPLYPDDPQALRELKRAHSQLDFADNGLRILNVSFVEPEWLTMPKFHHINRENIFFDLPAKLIHAKYENNLEDQYEYTEHVNGESSVPVLRLPAVKRVRVEYLKEPESDVKHSIDAISHLTKQFESFERYQEQNVIDGSNRPRISWHLTEEGKALRLESPNLHCTNPYFDLNDACKGHNELAKLYMRGFKNESTERDTNK